MTKKEQAWFELGIKMKDMDMNELTKRYSLQIGEPVGESKYNNELFFKFCNEASKENINTATAKDLFISGSEEILDTNSAQYHFFWGYDKK